MESETLLKLLQQALSLKEPDHLGDLIKIGLPLIGTIIGGFIGFLTAKKSADINKSAQIDVANNTRLTELKKEYGSKRNAKFTELMDNLDDFSQRLSNYVTLIKNAYDDGLETHLSGDKLTKIEDCEAIFSEGFLDLLTSESKLLALGHEDVADKLREFGQSSQNIFKEIHLKAELSVEEITEKMRKLGKQRKELIIAIGNAEAQYWT